MIDLWSEFKDGFRLFAENVQWWAFCQSVPAEPPYTPVHDRLWERLNNPQ